MTNRILTPARFAPATSGLTPSGRIGEYLGGIQNNFDSYFSQVAIGRLKHINVFGADYETRNGTGERDCIQVEDLAWAHLAAIEFSATSTGCEPINVGTGHCGAVFEMVKVFEHASGRAVPYKIGPRREGDVARSRAVVDEAECFNGWNAKLEVANMFRTTWNWRSTNLNGYLQD